MFEHVSLPAGIEEPSRNGLGLCFHQIGFDQSLAWLSKSWEPKVGSPLEDKEILYERVGHRPETIGDIAWSLLAIHGVTVTDAGSLPAEVTVYHVTPRPRPLLRFIHGGRGILLFLNGRTRHEQAEDQAIS